MDSKQNIDLDKLYDVIVIGGGPAGLCAALYLARAKYRVLVMEKEQFGGQITITDEVVNYPGVKKTSGRELSDTMRRQAEHFGAEFLMAEAETVKAHGDIKTVCTDRGDFNCFGILLATGAHPRSVGFKGEEEHKGHGVAYCATCDGEFFAGKDIYVVGGGYAAAEESVFLTKFARHVTILVREEDFTCAAAVAEPAKNHEKITVLTNTVVEEVSGENGLDYIRYKNINSGEVTEFKARDGETFGVFVFVGYAPATDLVRGVVDLDEYGYIITDSSQKTNVDGVYAAGDVCIKPLRQVVTATGDGALAATEVEKYAAAMQAKTGLHPIIRETEKNDVTISSGGEEGHFTAEMKGQLNAMFNKMQNSLVLKLYLDERPVSSELEEYMSNLAELTDKLTYEVADRNASSDTAPCVKVCRENGEETGLAFHGVPGGHEFTSFVIGIYNASGEGQSVDEDVLEEIYGIDKQTDIKVLVSLSCTMCPDLVIAAQKIASKNKMVTAEIYDISHFEKLRDKYNVMSVPCLVINDDKVSFGKKNIKQLLELIKE